MVSQNRSSKSPYSREQLAKGNQAIAEARQIKNLPSLDEIWKEREKRFESGEYQKMSDDERIKAEINFEKMYHARLRLDLSIAPEHRIDYARVVQSTSFYKVVSSYSKLFPDGTILSEEKIEFGEGGGHECFRVWVYPDGKSISWRTDDDTRRRRKEKTVSEETFRSESVVVSENPIIKHVYSASVSTEQQIQGVRVDLPEVGEELLIPDGLREKLTELKQKYRHGPWEFAKDSFWLGPKKDRLKKPNYWESFLTPVVILAGMCSFVLLIGLCFAGFELVKLVNQTEVVSIVVSPSFTLIPEGVHSPPLGDEYMAMTATAKREQEAQELIQQGYTQIETAEGALAVHDCAKGLPEAKGAVDKCTRAIELSPQNSEAYYCRARGYGLLEEIEKATADLQRALELGLSNGRKDEAERRLSELLARIAEQACSISAIQFNQGWDSSGYPISPSRTCSNIIDRINVFWELNGSCNNRLAVKWKYNDELACYHYYEPGEHTLLEGSMYTSEDGGNLPSGNWTVEVWDGQMILDEASCIIP